MRCWPVSVVLLKTTGSQGSGGLVLQGLSAGHTCGHVGQLRQCRGRGQALVAGVNYLLLSFRLPLSLLPLFCICLCICIGCAAPHCLLVSSLQGAEAAPCRSCRCPLHWTRWCPLVEPHCAVHVVGGAAEGPTGLASQDLAGKTVLPAAVSS